ncbi:unnamed protein product [Amoebophrya sp. A25]|nr:unnamed protein product [Amoebophrya sp. A25]|eukprot:GSA25T00027735001.1
MKMGLSVLFFSIRTTQAAVLETRIPESARALRHRTDKAFSLSKTLWGIPFLSGLGDGFPYHRVCCCDSSGDSIVSSERCEEDLFSPTFLVRLFRILRSLSLHRIDRNSENEELLRHRN